MTRVLLTLLVTVLAAVPSWEGLLVPPSPYDLPDLLTRVRRAWAAAPAFVAGGITSGNCSGGTATTSPTAGNLGIVVIAATMPNSDNPTLNSLSDGSSNYTLLDTESAVVSPLGTRVVTWVLYKNNIPAGPTTFTLSLSGTAPSSCGWLFHEISGQDTGSPIDQFDSRRQASVGNGTDVLVSNSVTTTTAEQYLFGWSINSGAATAGTITAGTNYMLRTVSRTEDRQVASTGTYTAPFTRAGGGTGDWYVGIVTVKAASGGGTAVRRRVTQQ